MSQTAEGHTGGTLRSPLVTDAIVIYPLPQKVDPHRQEGREREKGKEKGDHRVTVRRDRPHAPLLALALHRVPLRPGDIRPEVVHPLLPAALPVGDLGNVLAEIPANYHAVISWLVLVLETNVSTCMSVGEAAAAPLLANLPLLRLSRRAAV